MADEQYKRNSKESKPSLKDPIFNRGCCKFRNEYVAGQPVLNHGASKLNEFNWMKDYEGVTDEKQPLIAEVRFKNDHKDFYTYPEDLDLHEGELVAVEAAIGHDIGIVTLTGELAMRQLKRKRYRTPLEEMKKVYRRARPNDVEKWLSAIALEYSGSGAAGRGASESRS